MNNFLQFFKNNIWTFVLITLCIGLTILIGSNYTGQGKYSLTQSWLWIAIVITLFILLLGPAKKGHLFETLIDPLTKRISISRLQMAIWTVIVISAYFAIVMPRVRLPVTDLEKITELFSVGLPDELLALMGISAVSLTGSFIIKNNKQAKEPDPEALARFAPKVLGAAKASTLVGRKDAAACARELNALENKLLEEQYRTAMFTAQVNNPSLIPPVNTLYNNVSLALTNAQGKLLTSEQNYGQAVQAIENAVKNDHIGILSVNQTNSEASLMDLFTGEEMENEGQLELGKIQMFLITLITVITYIAAISVVMANYANNPADITDFPALSPRLVTLLAISHAGYLANNAVDKTKTL